MPEAPLSTPPVEMGTKAETLERLLGRLAHGDIPPLVWFTQQQWKFETETVLASLAATGWLNQTLVVRSSALSEDSASESMAGHFASVLNVQGAAALKDAIEQVTASFESQAGHQIIVQPQICGIRMSGVAFSRDPNTGSAYLVINYDDRSGLSDSVTAGRASHLRTYYHHLSAAFPPPVPLNRIKLLLDELETLFGWNALDIEFALDDQDRLWLLQVRRLTIPTLGIGNPDTQKALLEGIAQRMRQLNGPHPYLQGERTAFGVMPDWNPAEIIGLRPGPLALSMYRELVTDTIWAYQRNNYGYRNLRSFPLLQSFAGSPYIDVRLSFNSFLPEGLPDELASRLANYYINRLIEHPKFHDKVEFEILFSCYTLDLPDRLQILLTHGFNQADCRILADSLRHLTNRIIHTQSGLWKADIAKIHQLTSRRQLLENARLDLVSRIYWLLEDAKRYGTLPFAGLARAGFIAVQILRSLVSTGVLSPAEYQAFMLNLETVSSRIGKDLAGLSREAFLRKYGHLRPGTYDLLSPRYDEAPERYFDWSQTFRAPETPPPFVLSLPQLKAVESLLRSHGLEHNIMELFDFLKEAIEGREYAKFVFTRNLSDALKLFAELAANEGFSREAAAMADVNCIRTLYTTSRPAAEVLAESIATGTRQAEQCRQLILPPLLTREQDLWAFELAPDEPNFITLQRTMGPIAFADRGHEQLKDTILLIESADPGYDWVFSHGIKGLITKFGGVNSHMAIRAGELGLPAVIGAGDVLYAQWSKARILELNCENRQVRVLS